MTYIPRRLSVDDFYNRRYPDLYRRVKVFLDGKEIQKVRCYDMDAGSVTRLVVDEEGKVQRTPQGYEVLEETLYGKVTVELTS